MAVKTKLLNLTKAIIFVLLGCIIILYVNKMFGVSNEFSDHSKMMISGYYDLEENSVDVVAVGNSHVYRYIQNAFAWKEKGLAITTFSSSDMPCGAVKSVITECLKTQSPKVFLIDATVFINPNDKPNNKIFLLAHNMKYSLNYVDMINSFCDYSNVDAMDAIKYYLPIVQFHSRWYELKENDFVQVQNSYLNSCYQEDFLNKHITGKTHIYTTKRAATSKGSERALRDLLAWIKEKDLKVLFYASPVLRGKTYRANINYIQDVVEAEGQEFVDFNDKIYYKDFGFDEDKDFQDSNHTNIKGSYKFTLYLSDFLMKKFDLPDRRGTAGYESWDKPAQEYYNIVDEYLKSKTK